MNTQRPITVLSAFVLIALLGVGHLFVPFVPDAGKIPQVVVYGDVVLGVMSLVAAFGLWTLKRWGPLLTLAISALNVLSAAPGVLAAPNPGLHAVAATYVVLSVLIAVLVVVATQRKMPAMQTSAMRE